MESRSVYPSIVPQSQVGNFSTSGYLNSLPSNAVTSRLICHLPGNRDGTRLSNPWLASHYAHVSGAGAIQSLPTFSDWQFLIQKQMIYIFWSFQSKINGVNAVFCRRKICISNIFLIACRLGGWWEWRIYSVRITLLLEMLLPQHINSLLLFVLLGPSWAQHLRLC